MKKAILWTLGTLLFFFGALLIVGTSNTPDIQFIKGGGPEGYQKIPDSYIISASYAKCMADAGYLIPIFGILIGAVIVFFYTLRAEYIKSPTWTVYAIGWGIAFLSIGIPLGAKTTSSSYSSNISVDVYEANKGNLDQLFPMIEK